MEPKNAPTHNRDKNTRDSQEKHKQNQRKKTGTKRACPMRADINDENLINDDADITVRENQTRGYSPTQS